MDFVSERSKKPFVSRNSGASIRRSGSPALIRPSSSTRRFFRARGASGILLFVTITSVTCTSGTSFLLSRIAIQVQSRDMSLRGPGKNIMVDSRHAPNLRWALRYRTGVFVNGLQRCSKHSKLAKTGLQGGAQVSA